MKEGKSMAFKDLLNKGLDIINSGAKAVSDAAKEKKAAMQEFDLLKTRSDHIGPMNVYEVKNDDPQPGKEQLILNACLTINVEKSKVVNKCIPIDETIIDVKTCKEAKTEIEYALVITDKRLWIINKNEYMTMEFDQIKECSIINKGLMSQGVKFDDKAFTIDGNEADVTRFFETLKNSEYRNDAIKRKIAYLMGIVPQKQIININMKGITVGENGAIVLHNNPENKVVNVRDIQTVQLMVNDSAALVKGRTDSANFMSSPMEARKMAVKVILGMGEYTIETMPQNMMNTSYRREDTTYINNYNFAKSIIEALGELIRNDVAANPVAKDIQDTNVGSQSIAPNVSQSIETFSDVTGNSTSGQAEQAKTQNEYPTLDVFHINPNDKQ